MELTSSKKVFIGAFILALAVSLGAMGAHALEKSLSIKQLATFKTGVNYHFIHGLGIVFLALLEKSFSIKLTREFFFFLSGIILFSCCCYLYAVTGIKTFAMVVPVGGVAFIVGWLLLAFKFRKSL
ncbi:DUF423 domain-containing protein [Halobacteriovorax sp. HLS]|uniref:DUF423 domain-containing protein n=1 Tax=Halobacteriovorax sp. HLS TaxID=2234000 RepID=UPI000FDAEB63|nr:DUF423 domain-containing protein [Halobacteriovorax sp. HLS]